MFQEGVFTTIFGIFAFFVLPGVPEDVPFLTLHEKNAYLRRLKDSWSGDAVNHTEAFRWSEVWSVLVTAPHATLVCLPLFCNGMTVRHSLCSLMSPDSPSRHSC